MDAALMRAEMDRAERKQVNPSALTSYRLG